MESLKSTATDLRSNLFTILTYLITAIILLLSTSIMASDSPIPEEKKFILLTIDGGGVRGVIPARILQEIEAKTNKPIYHLIDTIAGNSTGGIIALSLLKPDATGKNPEYKAKDLVDLYMNYSKDIFARSFWVKLKTGFGLWGAKYSRDNLDEILHQRFGNSSLQDVLKPVLIFSYNLNYSEGHIWNSELSKINPDKNFYLRDIAAATSAAPTYFDPVRLSNTKGTYCYKNEAREIIPVCLEADGGIFSNNPSLTAAASVLKHNPNLKISDLIVVSIGTGIYHINDAEKKLHNASSLNWLVDLNIIDLILNESSDLAQWATEAIGIKTYRIQMKLPKEAGKLDDASEENLNTLLIIAENYIKENQEQINALCKLLLENAK